MGGAQRGFLNKAATVGAPRAPGRFPLAGIKSWQVLAGTLPNDAQAAGDGRSLLAWIGGAAAVVTPARCAATSNGHCSSHDESPSPSELVLRRR